MPRDRQYHSSEHAKTVTWREDTILPYNSRAVVLRNTIQLIMESL